METPEKVTIVLVGAGNLATHLGKALVRAGYDILQVYSRTEDSARNLAGMLDAGYTTSAGRLVNDASLYIVSLKDSVVPELLPEITAGRERALFVHTSGSTPMDIWEGKAGRYGVLYPLQTFSKQRDVSFAEMPILLEASDQECYSVLETLAKKLSEKVLPATSEQRKYIHLSAVFACNFVNRMYAIGEKILREHGLPFELLLPLIDETARKVHELPPRLAQTGPAVRYDRNIIERHLELLSDHPGLREMYEQISKNIYNS